MRPIPPLPRRWRTGSTCWPPSATAAARCRTPTSQLHTGLSRPTVSRLTYTLAQLGYLKRDAKGRFELGLGVLAAAYPVLSALKVRQLARPLMRDFAAYTGGTVSIAMPFGLDFIYVETLRTTDAVPHVPDVGFTGTLATPRSAAPCSRSPPGKNSRPMSPTSRRSGRRKPNTC